MRLAQDTAGWTVATDYDDVRGRTLVKNAGFRWEPTRKVWATASATVAAELLAKLWNCDEVAEHVADAIGKAVADEGAQAAEAVAASRAMDCNIDIPAPEGLSYGKVQKHHELVHDASACLENLAIQPNVTNELLHRDQVRAHAFRVRVMKGPVGTTSLTPASVMSQPRRHSAVNDGFTM
ncbi:MAG: hypothetical protein J0H80_00385 [Rhizobiales bacterium]|nr:hypothetical protein [Hyphomicrobiales bacterium]